MKKIIRFLFIIIFNIFLVTIILFSIGKLKKEKAEKNAIELTHADTSFMYQNIEYHEDYVGSLYDENIHMATFFHNGYAPVAKDYKWGFIDKTGKMITDYKASPIDHGPDIFMKLFKERLIL